MSVKTNFGEYPVGNKDAIENFHGNQLVYIAWDNHLAIGPANVFAFPPEMSFSTLTEEVIPNIIGAHPDFECVDWTTATWVLDGEPLSPNMGESLIENGVGHKSLLRFKTPGLNGYQGTGN